MHSWEPLDAFGITQTLADWARAYGVRERRLAWLVSGGLPLEIALQVPKAARVDPSAPPGAPNSWTWHVLRFEHDPWCQALIKRNGAMTLEQIADVLGMERERVRQLEEEIFRKLRAQFSARELRALVEAA